MAKYPGQSRRWQFFAHQSPNVPASMLVPDGTQTKRTRGKRKARFENIVESDRQDADVCKAARKRAKTPAEREAVTDLVRPRVFTIHGRVR